jgi:hypothetical protein
VPQLIDIDSDQKKADIYFRTKQKEEDRHVTITSGDNILIAKKYIEIRPSELEHIQIDIDKIEDGNITKSMSKWGGRVNAEKDNMHSMSERMSYNCRKNR